MYKNNTTVYPTSKSSRKPVKNANLTREHLPPFLVNIKDPADFRTSPFFFNMILAGVQRKLRKLI
jgi:hypothetical protein